MPCINYEKPFDEIEPFLALGKMLIVALSCIRFVYFKLDTNYFIRNSVYGFEWHEDTTLPSFCQQCINSIWIVNANESRKKGHLLYVLWNCISANDQPNPNKHNENKQQILAMNGWLADWLTIFKLELLLWISSHIFRDYYVIYNP